MEDHSALAAYPKSRAAWYAVAVLTVCYTFSFVDRLILAFLVTPMKHDLHLSDTQIGLLQGAAFAVLYSVLGIPFGLAADRTSRRNLIAAGVLFWSLMTSCGSLARTFWTLALTRVGVGVGEATLSPAAFSLIADSFPRERLSSALSIYSMGVQVGAGLALILGGLVVQIVTHMAPVALPWVGTVPAWRLTFLIVGAPGILLVALLTTLIEPARRLRPLGEVGTPPRAGLKNAFGQLRTRWRSAIGISVLMACQAMSNYAFGSWSPAFLERLYHWPKGQIGLLLGGLTIGCGCIGLICGGRLSDHWLRSGMPEAPLRVAFLSLLGAACTMIPALSVHSAMLTVVLLVPGLFFLSLPIGCLYASVQMIFSNEVRGTVSAIVLLVVSLGGVSLGSLLPGLLDDRFFHSDLMLGRSMAITLGCACLTGIVAAVLTYGPYRRDFQALRTNA